MDPARPADPAGSTDPADPANPAPRTDLARRLRLIVLTDATLAAPRSVIEVAAEALEAGAPAIQLRDKASGAGALLALALELRRLTRAAGALLFVNDRFDVALAAGADGVHLGPDDLPVAPVRSAAPPGFLIGRSADDPELASRAVADGADYIGCGTVYPTRTKPDAGAVIGLERLAAVAARVTVPVVAIGGITPPRVAEIASGPAAGVAVVGAVMGADDVRRTVREMLAAWGERAHG